MTPYLNNPIFHYSLLVFHYIMLQQYIQFLSELEQNNSKEWFDVHRARYKELNEQFQTYVGEIIQEISKYDATIKYLTPKDCTFRINRDVRFSPNKMPYKTQTSAGFNQGGKSAYTPGYYFQIDYDGNMMIAGGQWFIESKDMFLFRTKIDEKADQLREVLKDKEFVKKFKELKGEKLKTCPKGFSKGNLNLDLLVHKSFSSYYNLNVLVKTDYEIKQEILTGFKAINSLVQFAREIML
jgi:uncharacterized protein (TIGR02453 family)